MERRFLKYEKMKIYTRKDVKIIRDSKQNLTYFKKYFLVFMKSLHWLNSFQPFPGYLLLCILCLGIRTDPTARNGWIQAHSGVFWGYSVTGWTVQVSRGGKSKDEVGRNDFFPVFIFFPVRNLQTLQFAGRYDGKEKNLNFIGFLQDFWLEVESVKRKQLFS